MNKIHEIILLCFVLQLLYWMSAILHLQLYIVEAISIFSAHIGDVVFILKKQTAGQLKLDLCLSLDSYSAPR